MNIETEEFTDRQKVLFQTISIKSLIKTIYKKIDLLDELTEDNKQLSTENIYLRNLLEKEKNKTYRLEKQNKNKRSEINKLKCMVDGQSRMSRYSRK